MKSWEKNRKNQSNVRAQLSWEAEVVEYVACVHKLTAVHGNKKGAIPPSLKKDIPILGPHFLPPGYIHAQKRDTPQITPDISYLRAITVVHPFYFPTISGCCPGCGSSDTLLEGWTTKGARDVHGLHRDERAIGVQIICKQCRSQYEKGGPQEGKGHFCFATTAKCFWAKWEHWRIPGELHVSSLEGNHLLTVLGTCSADGIPHFLTRCAVTRELFDVIVELRPSLTSGGLAENIKRLWFFCLFVSLVILMLEC